MKLKNFFKNFLEKLKKFFNRAKEAVKEEVAPPPSPTPENGSTGPLKPLEPPKRVDIPSGWPPGTTQFQPGVFYVDGYGPFARPTEYFEFLERVRQRDGNLARWQDEFDSKVYEGPIPVESLSDEDLAYMAWRRGDFQVSTNGKHLFYTVLSGTHKTINQAINRSNDLNPNQEHRTTSNVALMNAIDWIQFPGEHLP